MNTTEEEVTSIREELERQFDANPQDSTAKPTETPTTAMSTDAPPETTSATPKPSETTVPSGTPETPETAATEATRPIPERLKAEWGSKWDQLDPAVKKQFHAYESDIGRVTSKYGQAAKNWNETLRMAAPYQEMISSEGGTLHGAVSNLLETARILRQGLPEQKVQLVKEMIRHFNIPFQPGAATSPQADDPSSLGQPSGASPELIDRLTQLERRVLTGDAEQVHNLRERVNSEVETFLADTANIYLQEPGYLNTMQALIRSGKADNLKSAYDQAAWLHDRTRQLEIAKINQQKSSTAAAQAARARTAAVSTNGTSPGPLRRDPNKMSLRETLEAAFDGDLET